MDRRHFLIGTAIAGTGLGISVGWRILRSVRGDASTAIPLAGAATPIETNTWIRVRPDNSVTITISRSEMGQGIETAIAMMVVEEMEADWNLIKTEWATEDPAYGNQHTAASSSVRQMWQPMREAGAAARAMLVGAAAQNWDVSASDCRAENSEVVHPDGLQRVTFGSVANKAAALPVPENVPLKAPHEFKIIGRRMPRLDVPKKVDGSAIFGWDVDVPKMLIASVTRCPVKNGHLADYRSDNAEAIRGVKAVLPITEPYAPSRMIRSIPPYGLAVVADTYWSAHLGKEALEVSWNLGDNAKFNTESIAQALAEWAASDDTHTVIERGSLASVEHRSKEEVSATYRVPYLAHVSMSPMCCTADVRDDSCAVWAPTQSPDLALKMVEKHTGLPRNAITIHKTYLGGGFGRRQRQDYVGEAIQISKAMKQPVKVLWSREEDIQHDYFRPMAHDELTAWLDGEGFPVGWRHRLASTDNHALATQGVDQIPYDIPYKFVDRANPPIDSPVRISAWRGVSHSQNAFAVEGFVDELAHAGGHNPYDYRRYLLRNAPRYLDVLNTAASKAGWGKPLQEGRYQGIAIHECGESIAADITEISIVNEREVKVHKVVCAVDCGLVIDPDGVEAQISGSIIDGLAAALFSEITIKDGRVQQSNFHDYPILRMNQIPEIEVHVVNPNSPDHIGGAGEVALPPLAPAVTNAVFAATGKRIRELPIRLG